MLGKFDFIHRVAQRDLTISCIAFSLLFSPFRSISLFKMTKSAVGFLGGHRLTDWPIGRSHLFSNRESGIYTRKWLLNNAGEPEVIADGKGEGKAWAKCTGFVILRCVIEAVALSNHYYRASHVLEDLGWVELDLGSPGWWAATAATYCLSRMVEHPKSKSTKPSPQGHGTPCIDKSHAPIVTQVVWHKVLLT